MEDEFRSWSWTAQPHSENDNIQVIKTVATRNHYEKQGNFLRFHQAGVVAKDTASVFATEPNPVNTHSDCDDCVKIRHMPAEVLQLFISFQLFEFWVQSFHQNRNRGLEKPVKNKKEHRWGYKHLYQLWQNRLVNENSLSLPVNRCKLLGHLWLYEIIWNYSNF